MSSSILIPGFYWWIENSAGNEYNIPGSGFWIIDTNPSGGALPTPNPPAIATANYIGISYDVPGITWNQEVDGKSNAYLVPGFYWQVVKIGSRFSVTLDELTLSGTAELRDVLHATGNITLDNVTLGGSGDLKISGSLVETLNDLTVSGQGNLHINGTLNIVLGTLTLSGTGKLEGNGNLNITLEDLTLSGSGGGTVIIVSKFLSYGILGGGVDNIAISKLLGYGILDASIKAISVGVSKFLAYAVLIRTGSLRPFVQINV